MTDEAIARLFHPFDRDFVSTPACGERFMLFGAGEGFRLPKTLDLRISAIQDFRPSFLALQRAGYDVNCEPDGREFAGALVLLGRNRRENELNVLSALLRVSTGGLIVAAGASKEGASSLRKRLAELGLDLAHAAKHHGDVFWLERPAEIAVEIAEALGPNPQRPEGFVTAEGSFSADGIDPASCLLAEALPDDLKGEVADFAAGWGYLAASAARKNTAIGRLDLYEAHRPSLLAAERNMAALAPGVPARFFWHDLVEEPVGDGYDVILMNPPFHQGRAAEPELGATLIRAASKALKRGGRLFMVANRPLPYGPVLTSAFRRHDEIAGDKRFKVTLAVK